METRLFTAPHSCSLEYYAERLLADHVNEAKHALRIYLTAAVAADLVRFRGVKSVGDFGAGNGGMLEILSRLLPPPGVASWGYDLMTANVADAQANGRPVMLHDFMSEPNRWPELVIASEVLEHLPDPGEFLSMVPSGARVLATVPRFESAAKHWAGHLWAWDLAGLRDLFLRNRYAVERLEEFDRVLLIVGRRP